MKKVLTYDLKPYYFRMLAGYFDVHPSSDILSPISYDIDTVSSSLSADLIQMAAAIITIAGAFLTMIMISPRLVLVFVFMVPWGRGVLLPCRILWKHCWTYGELY